MKINQQIIFPTPLFEIEIPEIDNKKLSEDIYELRKSDKGMSKSNIGGWHSSTQHNKIDKISIKDFTLSSLSIPRFASSFPSSPSRHRRAT